MKHLLTIFFFLSCIHANAKNIYVSSSDGLDTDNGLTEATAYRSLTKVNAIFASLAPGDFVLFKRGDTFLGSLNISRSGLAGNVITLGAYGTGAKPNISGLMILNDWTSLGSNLWDCQPDSSLKANCNVMTINGYPREVGRYPNTGSYLVYSSATATQLNTSLPASPSYTGAEVVMKYNSYVIARKTITNHSGSTLTIANPAGIDDARVSQNHGSGSNYGYFLQRFQNSLDVNGEWYFNRTTNRFRIYSTVNPSTLTIKASFKDTVINCNSRTYITFDNLQIEGGGIYGLSSYNGSNITIQNCTFLNNTRAIYMWNAITPVVQYNYIRNSFNNAILINGNSGTPARNVNCNYNYVDSTGMLMGMAPFQSDNNMKGIVCKVSSATVGNYLNIIGNTVKNVGHMSIQFQGSNVMIKKNWTDSICLRIQDGGGIYTFVLNTAIAPPTFTNRVIDSNMVSNSIGGGWGVGSDTHVDVAGIYLDDQTPNVTVKNNAVWNVAGNAIQMNTPTNISITDNTVYNCLYAINHNKRKYFGSIGGITASRNILYQKLNTQYIYYTVNDTLNPQTITQWVTGMVTIDSNWTTDLKTTGYQAVTRPTTTSGYTTTNISRANWLATYGHDTHSSLPPITVTTSNTMIVTNPSDTAKTVGFIGSRYRSPKNIAYDNYILLQPWTSAVLISNGIANIPPVSNSGSDKSITLCLDSITQVGSATDADGTVSTYAWAKISGPSTYTISTPTTATTKIKNLVEGVYKFSLTVTDNAGTANADTMQVTVAANSAPSANAGADQTKTLPVDYTSVLGVGTDAEGSVTYLWSRISGPNTPTLPTPTATGTGINGMIAGVYQYKYTVTDNCGLSTSDTVIITVNAAVNQAPTSNAGADASITLPTTSTTLNGSGNDPDGTISTYAWTQITGPNTATFGTASAASTTVNGLIQGVYKLRLTVTDNQGATGFDEMDLTVNAAANLTPSANAGSDVTTILPISTVNLTGSGNDPDGTISAYAWTKISGPSGGTIASASSANTAINSLQEGEYIYELTVTDDDGATASDQVTITVSPNPAPVADAGTDIVVTLPTSTTTLNGSGTDNVSISSYAWVKLSGPAGGTISNSAIAGPGLSALQYGVYQYELTVTDNGGATDKDTVQVTVNLAPNVLPSANASIDRGFDPPRDTITIFGSGTDSDGTISSYGWRKILGPGAYIVSPTSATTIIDSLVSGTYQFELTVTDDRGGVAKDTMQLIVSDQPFNIPPVVTTPHPAVRVTLPTDSVTLIGVATDEDGEIVAYQWTGNGGTIVSPDSATTVIRGLAPGVYTFTLTVIDNGNAVAYDQTTVVVSAAPTRRILLGFKVQSQ